MSVGLISTAREAIEYYAQMRTFNEKGVTIPSQIRYIQYFETGIKNSLTMVKYLDNMPSLYIKSVKVGPIPNVNVFGGCTPWVLLTNGTKEYKSKYSHDLITYKNEEFFQLPMNHQFTVAGDFKLTFFTKGLLNKSERFMHVWLNTYFMEGESLVLSAHEIDGVKPGDNRFSDKLEIRLSINWL
jgi:phosphatidylinositol-3,4,5-trisphosphate 3-phosphatase/dual-specificity protein phosphatase PTEN